MRLCQTRTNKWTNRQTDKSLQKQWMNKQSNEPIEQTIEKKTQTTEREETK